MALGVAGIHHPSPFALKEQADEFGLPVGSCLFKNSRELGFGCRIGRVAPPRRSQTTVTF
ncbi:MAG: hypothetical protein FWC84_00835 [Alphaproteobacteria bacterium]|nr:hypothetical protein [Alphaproteobacteria bacterium]